MPSARRAFKRSLFAVKSKISNDPDVAKTAVMACYRQLPIALSENGLQQQRLA
jgi:hypothetical protein